MLYKTTSILFISALFLSCSSTYHTSESDKPCEVLVESISENYEGYCKDGLAHGEGTAQGIHTYEGAFVKGYPDGKGTYIWHEDRRYEGGWTRGLRSGFGTEYFKEQGQEKVNRGFWQEGELVVRTDENTPYSIESQRGSVSTKLRKQGELKNMVKLAIRRDGQNVQGIIQNFTLNHTSGTQRGSSSSFEDFYIENISYPVEFSISYRIPSKMMTTLIDINVQLEIFEPGYWVIELDNK